MGGFQIDGFPLPTFHVQRLCIEIFIIRLLLFLTVSMKIDLSACGTYAIPLELLVIVVFGLFSLMSLLSIDVA